MLSVIVVNYNTKWVTMECLKSIEDQAEEIIVVDNGSTDGSVDLLGTWAAQADHHKLILNADNVGFAGANNQGISEASRQNILLLNSDTLVPPDALRRLADWFDAHPEMGACGPRLVFADGTPQHSPCPVPTAWMYVVRFLGVKHIIPWPSARKILAVRLRPLLGKMLVSYMDPGTMDWTGGIIECLSGAALLVRRQVIDEVGGLDEGFFMYLEDVDWCIRIRQGGWQLGFVPEVEILHYAGASYVGGPLKKSYRASEPESYKSIVRYFAKHHGMGARLLVRGAIALSLLVQSLAAIARLGGRERASVRECIARNVSNLRVILFSPAPVSPAGRRSKEKWSGA